MVSEFNHRTGRFYNWACYFYPLIEPWIKGRRKLVIEAVNAEPSGRLLDIGVGTGGHLGALRGHRVSAIDISDSMLRSAAYHAGDNRIDLKRMDGEELTFLDGVFDYVLLSHVLSVTERPERMMGEVFRVLRPGGRAYVLNHETPKNFFRLFDFVASSAARMIRLKMWFRLDEVQGIDRFKILHRRRYGWFGSFAITVLEK
jgi:phosphatidylethanolamine/phosphatidyl-N-methylethanolamine N-methyltransferase